MSVTRTCH